MTTTEWVIEAPEGAVSPMPPTLELVATASGVMGR
jgi:hypothetical protein